MAATHPPGQEQRLIVPPLPEPLRMKRDGQDEIKLVKRKFGVGIFGEKGSQWAG